MGRSECGGGLLEVAMGHKGCTTRMPAWGLVVSEAVGWGAQWASAPGRAQLAQCPGAGLFCFVPVDEGRGQWATWSSEAVTSSSSLVADVQVCIKGEKDHRRPPEEGGPKMTGEEGRSGTKTDKASTTMSRARAKTHKALSPRPQERPIGVEFLYEPQTERGRSIFQRGGGFCVRRGRGPARAMADAGAHPSDTPGWLGKGCVFDQRGQWKKMRQGKRKPSPLLGAHAKRNVTPRPSW